MSFNLKENILLVLLFILGISACKKEQFLTVGGNVQFSVDTVMFDSAWSSSKTSTQIIKLYNPQNQKIKTDIFLAKDQSSFFDINVNGTIGKRIEDVEIAARDSVFIFLTMKVDANNENTPFIVEDNLVANVNGNEKNIPIIAYAQNAYYINDSVLTTSTLNTDKPYVILNSALVAEGNTLTIPAGARIYMHRNSRLFVSGTLNVNGTLEQPVTFQGDRLDRKIYEGDTIGVPGEWGGIYFTSSSHNNIINYAIIKNGGLSTKIGDQSTIGAVIQVDKDELMNGTPKLKITNTKILNALQYGLIAFSSSIEAENCLIAECQSEALLLLQGGKYKWDDCTIGNWGRTRFNRRLPNSTSVVVQNFYNNTSTTYVGSDLIASFNNCILYGSYENEFIASKRNEFAYNLSLDHCLIRSVEAIPDFVNITNTVWNKDPKFIDLPNMNYRVSEGSPAIEAGFNAGNISTDITGKTRSVQPTIGAYEY